MIKLIVLAMVAVLTAAAAQDSSKFYDKRGNSIGSATTTGNTTTFYDARGNKVGTATISPSGVTTFRDQDGRTMATTDGWKK
jgi:YD repeat-containing protein